MLPRLIFVIGMTIGVMAPIIWAAFTSVPTLSSHEGRTARGAPNPLSDQRSDHPPIKSEKAKNSDTANTKLDAKSITSPSTQTGKSLLPLVQGPKVDRSTASAKHSNAPVDDGGTSRSGGESHDATGGSKDVLSSVPSSPPPGSVPLSSSKNSNGTAESKETPPDRSSNAPPTEATKSTSISKRQRATAESNDATFSPFSHPPLTKNKKSRSKSESSETTAEDKGLCGFGSYLACTNGTCWRFCY
jgi:hypothetical protein